jgi:hypothetical protein
MTSMVDIWLSRSGVLPLSLSVFVSPGADPNTETSSLLEALICFSSRWKEIQFTLPFLQSFQPLSKLSPEHLFMLESVRVKMGQVEFGGVGSESVFAFLGAPTLHSASVSAQLLHVSIPLPWGLLRHLHLSNDTGGYIGTLTALQLLRQCVLLESCVLIIWSTEEPLPEVLCRMEHIQHLCVTVVGDIDGLVVFFRKLDFPNLRSLEYTSFENVQLAFLPMLSSARSVESLTIVSSPSMTDLAVALRSMPMLQELRLANPPNHVPDQDSDWRVHRHDELITLLTPEADAGSVASPQLQRITLRKVQVLSDGALLKFIQARTGPHLRDIVHLAAVHVQFFRPMEIDILPPLRELLAAGLEVTLDYQPTPGPSYWPFEGLESHDADFAHVRIEWD